MSETSPDGIAIQLVGQGPFVINSPITVKAKRLVVTASENSQPLIVFAAGGQDSFGSFNVIGGTLELRGVHISADPPAGRVATLLSVQ